MPERSVHCYITSPPYYGLRDYGVEGQIGLEETPAEFITRLVEVFREVRRALRDDGACWVNMGDSYAGTTLPANWACRYSLPARSPSRQGAQHDPPHLLPRHRPTLREMRLPAHRPALTKIAPLRLYPSAHAKQQYRRHGESTYDK